MKPREHPWSCNWDYWCISGMWWWLPSMLRNPIHSPTKQPKAGSPFIQTHAKGRIWSKPSHASIGFSNLCNVSICTLGCPFQPPMVHGPPTDSFVHSWYPVQPQCIQRKKFIHLQVIRPGKDTRRYTAALGPAIANRIRICSHEEAIVSSLNVVWQPSWPSNKHAAGEILLEIVPGSHNCGRGEKKKNPHLSATQPKHVHRKQSQGFFFKTGKLSERKIRPFLSFF